MALRRTGPRAAAQPPSPRAISRVPPGRAGVPGRPGGSGVRTTGLHAEAHGTAGMQRRPPEVGPACILVFTFKMLGAKSDRSPTYRRGNGLGANANIYAFFFENSKIYEFS